MPKLDYLTKELQSLREQSLLSSFRVNTSPTGPWIEIDGKRVLNLCANNYLGFADNPKLKEAAHRAIDKYGVGPGAGRSICGTQAIHVELESKIAAFKGAEACVTMAAGFSANLATIPAITGEGDVIFSDQLNHASIIDGCRLSKAEVVRYNHCDMEDLRTKLEQYRNRSRHRLIVTDGVFSMDGDVAPLPELVELGEEYDAAVMVDDAHGEGVLGQNGRGVVNHFGLDGRVEIEVGTLSKAFGVMGGYVTGSADLVEYIKQRGRPFVFSTPISPADAAAAIAAIDTLEQSDELVRKLWANAEYFRSGLKRLGFDTGSTVTPITPVILKDEKVTVEFSRSLHDMGVFAMSIVYPVVARGKARIRCMPSAAHSTQDLDFAIECFESLGGRFALIS